MTVADRKDINDPDFLSDDYLESIADEVEYEPVDLAADDEEGDDVEDADDADDAGDDEDDSGDEADDDDAGDVDEDSGDSDDAPVDHLADPEVLRAAYDELRGWANKRDMEANKLAERIAALEADDFDDEPEFDHSEFAQIQDPSEQFYYALTNGSYADASQVIARVQSDAQMIAAQAAQAAQAGQEADYQRAMMDVNMLNGLAQTMSGEMNQHFQRQQAQPLVEAERQRALQAAEYELAQATQGDYTQNRDRVIEVLRERPHLITGHSQQEIRRGLQDAYTIARTIPQQQDASATSIDAIVKAAVDKHIADTRAAKKAAADSARGAGGDRANPGNSRRGKSEKDRIYEESSSRSMGARNFMDM